MCGVRVSPILSTDRCDTPEPGIRVYFVRVAIFAKIAGVCSEPEMESEKRPF